ncbi:DNA-directed RNA polymerase subunit delta [Metabacillus iocasae]|uniref:Probable DNA-directed RNA polymerase subunit delta n=1 Tax=Priestia iocasae TaxID=2291674 RepID=A0ABS2QX86_9BACI|nr:DNA-directed RNA polymerase subunit delta [Metabacillus iocasae]MBM7704083.1 DNA-directed RNA polymerase subunit delta [Metabacillus iocasae]
MSLAQYSKEQLKEMSMIGLTYTLLSEKADRTPMSFQEIMNEVKAILELTDEEVKAKIAQFYTDLNIDGRFISVGENRWGLRSWYPYDQIDEEVLPAAKPKKKKAKKVVDEDIEDFDDLDEEDLEYEDLDSLDEDDDEEEDFESIDADDFDDESIEEDEDEDYDLEDEELEDDLEYEEEEDEDK